MTAINVLLQSKAVHVFTDGAAYRSDGTLQYFTSKAWPLPHLNAVIAARGSPFFAPNLTQYIGMMSGPSFETLAERIVDVCKTASAEMHGLFAQSGFGSDFDLVLAGWSTVLDKPRALLVSNHSKHGAVVPEWSAVELSGFSMLPLEPLMKDKLQQLFPNGAVAESLVADGIGSAIMEIQRLPADHGKGVFLPAAGGFVQITTITSISITTKVLRRWPDRVGEKLMADRCDRAHLANE